MIFASFAFLGLIFFARKKLDAGKRAVPATVVPQEFHEELSELTIDFRGNNPAPRYICIKGRIVDRAPKKV